MRAAVGVACLAALAIALDALVAALLVLDLRGDAVIDTAALVHDGGRCWRTPGTLLTGRFFAAAGDDGRALVDGEAILFEDDRPLEPARAAHQRIRDEGGGAWSFWRGQLYFSSSDGSDPATNGRRYRLTAPWRPTPLLALLAGATSLAVWIALRRRSPRFRAATERVVDAVATRCPGGGPHPLERAAPWLLAAAVAITFMSPSRGEWFAWDRSDGSTPYIPPYLGWSDAWIAAALLVTIAVTRTRPAAGVLAALGAVTLLLAAGGLDQGASLGWQPQITGLILGVRFALAFLAAWCVTRSGGARALAPAVALLGAIWLHGVARSAWEGAGQFIQVGGHYPSFAGMVLGLVILYSLRRGAYVWASLAAVGVVATGSRTALLATALAVIATRIRFGRAAAPGGGASSHTARTAVVAAMLIFGAGVAALLASAQLRAYLARKLAPTHWLSLGRRTDMIRWVRDTLGEGGWRWSGWGCGRGPAFLDAGVAAGTMPEHWGNLHVVWLEWLVELGLFALPLVALLLWRAARAWLRGPPLAAAIWLLFLLSQSFDYWLWARDGVVLWGLFLGAAEGMAKGAASAPSREVAPAAGPAPDQRRTGPEGRHSASGAGSARGGHDASASR